MRTLTSIVALLMLVSSAALAKSRPTPKVEEPRKALRSIFEELVEIDTTAEHGSVTKAVGAVAKRLRDAGVDRKEIQIVGPKPTKQNLVVRLRGDGSQKPLLLLAHLDVVEARREDWTVEPFHLLERDGFVYGRGTLDDKAMAAIFTELFIRLARDRVKPNRDIILALTADEEGGPDNGVEWLLRNQRALVDAGIVLNEGGGGRMRDGKYLSNTVQASEKTYMDFTLEVKDKGGHSSLPTRENAIYRLAAALGRLEGLTFPVEMSEITREYFRRSAGMETGQLATDMIAVSQGVPDEESVARLSETPHYNATMRTTCVATRLEGGHANNALPQLARAVVNCRVMPGHTVEEIRATIQRTVADPLVAVDVQERSVAGPPSPLDAAFLSTVEQVTTEMWPGIPVIPTMSTGASDSRYFRLAGIAAYGVSGIFVDMNDIRAHGRDERLGVKQLFEGQEFLGRLVRRLSGLR